MATTPPSELSILTYLQPRMNLSHVEKVKLGNLHKGYEGERKLQGILEKQLPPSYQILTDLLLRHNHTEFQIDILLIGNNTIYPIEVKNYEGDYVIQNDSWYAVSSRNEIRNPLHQLKRSELYLRKILKQTRFNFSIESHLIFIHPTFYLYQVPPDVPIIFRPQISRFIKSLQSIPFRQSTHHTELAIFLTDQSLSRSSNERLPHYDYERLRKGIVCVTCAQFMEVFNRRYLICKACEQKEMLESAVKQSAIEFMTLFPHKKMTTSIIHDWCNIIESKVSIRRILKKHYKQVGIRNHTYYVIKESSSLL